MTKLRICPRPIIQYTNFLSAVNTALQQQLNTALSVTVKQKTPVERENDVRKIYRADAGQESAFYQPRVNYDDSRMAEVVATRLNVGDVIQALREFQVGFFFCNGKDRHRLRCCSDFAISILFSTLKEIRPRTEKDRK